MTKVKMPDPIGHISVTSSGVTMSYLTNRVARSVRNGDTMITTTQAEAYANERVRRALEEAAELADTMLAFSVHDAIRALIPQEKKT